MKASRLFIDLLPIIASIVAWPSAAARAEKQDMKAQRGFS